MARCSLSRSGELSEAPSLPDRKGVTITYDRTIYECLRSSSHPDIASNEYFCFSDSLKPSTHILVAAMGRVIRDDSTANEIEMNKDRADKPPRSHCWPRRDMDCSPSHQLKLLVKLSIRTC